MANESMGLIGRKLGMTQIFRESGEVVAVTVIQTGTNKVMQVKTADGPDGYNALQLGQGTAKRTNKAQQGHNAKGGISPRVVREFRVSAEVAKAAEVGQDIVPTDAFAEGDYVDATAISRGRGFAGVMKKFNFKGFIRSHGTHEFFRHGGSIGTRLTPGHVAKGKKMPSHMGAKRVTVQNLLVARIDTERGLVFVKGGVPGAPGAIVTLRKAVKL